MLYYTILEPVKVQGYNAYLQWSNGRLNTCRTISDFSGVFCEDLICDSDCIFRRGFQEKPCCGCVTDHNKWLDKPCKLDINHCIGDDCYHYNDCHP